LSINVLLFILFLRHSTAYTTALHVTLGTRLQGP